MAFPRILGAIQMKLTSIGTALCLLLALSTMVQGAIATAPDSGRVLVIKGKAGSGDLIFIQSDSIRADSTGAWTLKLDRTGHSGADSVLDLCLERSGNKACTQVRPGIFDTLELAPLGFVDTSSSAAPSDTLPTGPERDSGQNASQTPVLVDDGKSASGRKITVKGQRRYKVLGQEKISAKDAKRLPSLGEPDVIRAVQALPGVAASSDFSTKLYVRGSASDENLILFDNAVVYSPNHFGGLFSSFLVDATGDMDFYKGGFESRYGNRLSSVLSVNSKTGAAGMDSANLGSIYAKGALRLTLFSGSLETEGRNGNWSWVMAGRRMWWDQASEALKYLEISDFSLDYHFYDIQGNLAWGNKGDTVRISLYDGKDQLDFDPLNVEWGNTVVPLNVRKRLFDGLAYKGALSYSRFEQSLGFSEILNSENSVKSINTRQELEYSGIPDHVLASGYEYDWFWIHFFSGSNALDLSSRERYGTGLHSGFLQDRWSLGKKNTIALGLRGYYYEDLDHTGWDPRFAYTFRPTTDWRFDFGIGHYTQYLTSIRFGDTEGFNEFWYGARPPMEPTTSVVTSLGAARSEIGKWNLNASWEGYYKEIHDVPLYYPNRSAGETADESGESRTFASDFTGLDGYALGTEFTIRKDAGRIAGMASYGYSQSVLKQGPYGNVLQSAEFEPYYADWDQTNTFKAAATFTWKSGKTKPSAKTKKGGTYILSQLQLNYHTGQPYTGYGSYINTHEPLQGVDGSIGSGLDEYAEKNIYLLQGSRNDTRKPYYLRLDVTPFETGRIGKWRFYGTVINILNRENVLSVTVDRSHNPPTKTFVNQFPIIPVFFGYEYEF
jgi:hypothetical protein